MADIDKCVTDTNSPSKDTDDLRLERFMHYDLSQDNIYMLQKIPPVFLILNIWDMKI